MAEIRINATGGVKLYDADDSHYAQIVAGTITSNVDAITLGHNIATFNAAITAGGVLKTDDATEATSTTDGSLQTDGGLSVVKDAVFGDDVSLLSDSAVLNFGADKDTTLTHTDGTGLTLNSTNKLCFNDATQFIQGASGTVLDIAATSEIELTSTLVEVVGRLEVTNGVIFNEASASVDFRVESNGDANCLIVDGSGDKVGIGEDVPEGKLHVFTGDASVGPHANADELVVEGSAHSGISILSGNSSQGGIYFGDSGDDNEATIVYDHNTQALNFTTYTTDSLRIRDAKTSTNGEAAPDVDSGGITLYQGANDGNIITLKSSDVGHGVTSACETDTYFFMKKQTAANGGVQIRAMSDGASAELFNFIATGTDALQTTANASAKGVYAFNCNDANGTGVQAIQDSGGIMMTISDYTTTGFIWDTDGDFHANNSSTTFDEYDDAQLARAVDLSNGKGVIDSKFDKFIAYNHEHLAKLKLVGREEDGTPNNFINVTGLQRLHNGAIWQQYTKHNQLLEAVYDLAKEAVGEEKANAILDKHEVKRLQ